MTDSIRHRGPDDSGFYRDRLRFPRPPPPQHHRSGRRPPAHDQRRPAPAGSSTTARSSITPACVPASKHAGHRYTTRCDTETILHAYEQYGPDCVTRFRGMFSFAIWDKNRRTLFCARDRLGISPSTTSGTAACSPSPPKSRRCWSTPPSRRASKNRCFRNIWPSATCSGERTLFRRHPQADARPLICARPREAESPRLKISRYWDIPAPAATTETRTDQPGSPNAAPAWKKPSACG